MNKQTENEPSQSNSSHKMVPAIRTLTLPEITLEVIDYLDIDSIQVISAVSRSMYESFSPYLWKYLHFGLPCQSDKCTKPLVRHITNDYKTTDEDYQQSLLKVYQKKASKLKELTIHEHKSILPLRFARRCTRLRSISMCGLSLDDEAHTKEHWISCKKIFKKSRDSLEEVYLRDWRFNVYGKPQAGESIWNPILTCARSESLCSLSLENCMIRSWHTEVFWTTCERLDKLALTNVSVQLDVEKPESSPWQTQTAAPTYNRYHRMTELSLINLPWIDIMDQLKHILCECPYIDTLTWNLHGVEHDVLNRFCEYFAEGTWCYLDKLVIHKSIQVLDFIKILESSPLPFEWLEFDSYPHTPEAFGFIRKNHFETIQNLNLQDIASENRGWIIEVLTSCPSLESIKASDITYKEIIDGGPWVCLGLQNFSIFIDMEFSPDSLNRELTPNELQQCQTVYRQLSTLRKLRKLDMLSSYMMDSYSWSRSTRVLNDTRVNPPIPLPLTLDAGLGELGGFKFEEVQCWSGKPRITEDEIAWMTSNWRRLKEFSEGCSSLGKIKDGMEDWLQERKISIQWIKRSRQDEFIVTKLQWSRS